LAAILRSDRPVLSGDTTDLDGDGLATLLECIFRSDPRQPSTAPIIAASTATVGNVRYIYLTFPRNRYATDVSLSCEGSEDCTTWHPVVPEIAATVTDFETEQWTVRLPTMASHFFVGLA
jgi:hypothetical protein